MASISISEPFIRRPVGTTLLAIGLFLIGVVAYEFLPVASVPNVDFPSIRVSASRPGADPSVMAGTVAAPLERRLGAVIGRLISEKLAYSGLDRLPPEVAALSTRIEALEGMLEVALALLDAAAAEPGEHAPDAAR